MLLPVQDRADPDEGRALLGGDAVVLARSHRQLGQFVLGSQLAEAAEVLPRLLGVLGGRRDFDSSPDRLTSTRAGTESLRAADPESRECTSSQMPFTSFALFDCR